MTTSKCAEFVQSGSTQSDWVERGKKVLMQTYATQPMVLTEGQGSYINDVDGKSYLDFASGIAVNALGHCHPAYVEALTKQLSKLSHCSNLYYNQPSIELAEKLVAKSAFDRAFFCNSGAEAVEGALKLSRKYAKKHKGENCTKILTMSNSFHGRTYGALSATAQTKYQEGFQPLVPDFAVVEFNNIDSILAHDLAAVAAIIIEPVQGEGGVHLADVCFLKEVRALCDEHKIVLIFDEIQCGVGRSGSFFASENFGVAPDIVALAKGLGGGFPVGAILANENIASAFNPGDHGSTFGGNPMAASAALACVNIIGDQQFLASVKKKSEFLVSALVGLKSLHSSIKVIRGLGLMLGIEFDIPVKSIIQKCAAQGLLLVGAGENVIRLLPPLTVSDDEINEAIGILAAELSKLIDQPEIVAPYKSAASRIGLVVFISLLPAWGIWAVYVACWLLRGVIQGGLSDYLDLFLLSLLFLTLPVIGITGIHSCLDNKIRFSSAGITFPFRFVLQLGGNLCRSWQSLQQIDFTNSRAPSTKPDFITFHFKGSEPLVLELGGLEEHDLRELIMTLDAYAPNMNYVPPRATIELNMPSLTGTKSTSFTRLWESELSSRFTSTAFVPLEPGSILQAGLIVVVGQIAFGGLSAIYLARRKDGTIVVLKEAVVPANADEETCRKALSMFDREAHFLIALKHARIARVFDHFVENGRHYLLLEHIDGTDLRRLVRDSGPQPESFVVCWGAEVADILEYLHSQSPPIVHRDVTPDNLVLANDGHITLIDFGAANEFVGTATGTLIGKQSYISPEQFRGKAQTASDLYSLGCTIYFLLTGEDPEPLSESSPRLKNSAVSIQLDKIVASCTAEETESRIRDAKLLAQSLRQLINSDARLGANE